MWIFFGLTLGLRLVLSLQDNIGSFWQLSDIHYDPLYSRRGDPNKHCHIHGNRSERLGYLGDYNCDSPLNLVLSVVQEMKKIESRPDFILWTGDSVPHYEQQSVADVYRIISNVTDFIPTTAPVIPVLGNHDAFPSDQMPLVGKDSDYYKNILTLGGWSAFLTKEEQQQFLAGGYYVKTYGNSSGLRFIVLNSNLWYSMNKLVADQKDPNNQFAWLRQQLTDAKTQNYKVYIVAHVCPGGFERVADMIWFYPKFNKQYVDIIQHFSSTIVAHFCGHEHTDSFRLVKNKDGSPSSMMFLSPALTPWKSTLPGVGANNPGVRLYRYSRTTGEVLNYFQYYMNLTRANKLNSSAQSVWQLEYQATEAYSLPDCSAASFQKMLVSLTNNSNEFKRYLEYNTVSYNMAPLCDQNCYLAQMCAILNIDIIQYNDCLTMSGTTPLPPPHTSTKPHHRKPRPLPRYVYYIIGVMGVVIVLLAVLVSCLCVRQRRHRIPWKYGRFAGSINS